MQKWFIWRNYLHQPALLLVCINKITCCFTHIPFNQLNHHQTQPTANKLPDWSKKKARLHLNIIFWPVHLMCSAFCLCFFSANSRFVFHLNCEIWHNASKTKTNDVLVFGFLSLMPFTWDNLYLTFASCQFPSYFLSSICPTNYVCTYVDMFVRRKETAIYL